MGWKTTWTKTVGLLLFAVLVMGGCTESLGPDEGTSHEGQTANPGDKNDSFLTGGKGDSLYDVQPGSPEAEGILELVNTASFEMLDDDVSLDVRAARNIVEARESSAIETLEQLDDISWVGSRAFGKLYDYAEANGYFADAQESIYGYEPDSAAAVGIVRAANAPDGVDAIREAFGFSEAFGVTFRTYRNTQTTAGTFDGLAEIDQIEGADRSTFDALLSYAEEAELVPATVFGIREETYRAEDILMLANRENERHLDETVGLDSRAAANIVDEREFDDLEELAEVPYVKGRAFEKLDAYADELGSINSCGDGRNAGGYLEECDDGNAITGDGCSSNCRLEYVCGNGTVEKGEACDDGNGLSQDGCAARTCQWERARESAGNNHDQAHADKLRYHIFAAGRLSGSYYKEDTDVWSFAVDSTKTVKIDMWGGRKDGACRGFYAHRDSDNSMHWQLFRPYVLIKDSNGNEVTRVRTNCGTKRSERDGEFDETVELEAGRYYLWIYPPEVGWGWDGDWSVGYGFELRR